MGSFLRFSFLCALLHLPSLAMTLEDTDLEAQRALVDGNTARAITLYASYLKDHPKDVKTLTALATCYGFSGDAKAQESFSRQALKIDPKNPDALVNLGNALSTQEKWDEAERTYLHAYAQANDQRDGASMRNIACALSNLYLARPTPSDQDAIRWADLCLARISESVLKGEGAFMGLRAHRPMEAMLELATYTSAIHNKAGAYGNLGKMDKAIKVLEAHLTLYPGDTQGAALLQTFSDSAP